MPSAGLRPVASSAASTYIERGDEYQQEEQQRHPDLSRDSEDAPQDLAVQDRAAVWIECQCTQHADRNRGGYCDE